MNLAILLGVSSYEHPVSSLPGCKNDVRIIERLLTAANKFNDILEVPLDAPSSEVKTLLAQFITKHRSQKVDELFFYYTGHGDLYKNDFYYLLADFTEGKRNQTSITNEELDSMLRTLSPSLVIKVVDACHAGVNYVKDGEALKKHLESLQGRFTDCYFMFSSQPNQSSFQDSNLSDFTRSFVEACTTFSGTEIRYRDVVDYISDAFSTNPDQTPTFVIQSSFVEVFCTITDEINKLLSNEGDSVTKRSVDQSDVTSTASLALTKASEYCTRGEAMKFISGFGQVFMEENSQLWIEGLFHISTELLESYYNLPGMNLVGQWLSKDKGEYFAKPTYEDESYTTEVPVSLTSSMLGYYSHDGYRTVTRTRSVIAGFECTAESPFKAVRINANPVHINLPHATAICVFIFSKKEFRAFYSFQTVKELDWDKLAPVDVTNWNYIPVVMKSDLSGRGVALSVLSGFKSFLEKVVKERLDVQNQST